ncbi:MAG: hypothetical protein ACIAXF_14255 [Phycisphaerales bacterium JB063]
MCFNSGSNSSARLALAALPVDNDIVKPDRKPCAPLPAALLTLAVVVCLGGAAQAGAVPTALPVQQRRAVITDREGLGQLVAAFAQAARKLGQHHDTQPALAGQVTPLMRAAAVRPQAVPAAQRVPIPVPLRAELTHLPPPARG